MRTPTSPDAAAAASRKSGFFIGVTCPGCGGDLELEDDFSVLTCVHCGSILRIVMPELPPAFMALPKVTEREIRFNIDRFLKDNGLPLTGPGMQFKFIYFPYWKVDAILLKVRNRIEERLVQSDDYESREVSYQKEETEITLMPHVVTVPAGHESAGVPDSIGVRARYVRLEPFSRERIDDAYDSLPIIHPWESVWPRIASGVANLNNISPAHFGKNRTELMHPVHSIVYFPYAIAESYQSGDFARFTVDAVTGRVLHHAGRPEFNENEESGLPRDIKFGSLEVTFHRCENCGFDLPQQKTFVAVCANCDYVNVIDSGGVALETIAVANAPRDGDNLYFPFWQFHIPPENAGLRRLMGGIYHSEWLSVPAFRMTNLEGMYRLSKRLTAAMPHLATTELESVGNSFLPVSVSAADAVTLAKVISFRKRLKNDKKAEFGDLKFNPQTARLLFVPFHEESYFFVDSAAKAVTFEKSAVRV